MKQLIQDFKTGEIKIVDVPTPRARAGHVLVRNAWSLVSAGTERSTVSTGQKSLIGKARARPDLVKKGKIITFSETFDRQGSFIAYYFPADTRSLALRASRPLDRTTTLALSLELRRTPHGDVEYRNRLFALSLQRRL